MRASGAVTNVRKHSGAGRAEIGFAVRDGRLEVVIADDGHGVEVAPSAADRPRYGIRAMRERADSIGAAIDWTSPPDGGCRVHVAVPARTPVPAATGAA